MRRPGASLRHIAALFQCKASTQQWPLLRRTYHLLHHTRCHPRLSSTPLSLHPLCSATPPPYSTPADVTSPDDVTPLARQLAARVRATGAMTVAEYMNEVLVHPLQGYYTRQREVGERGDFVTAPEVAGMYGEVGALTGGRVKGIGMSIATGASCVM